MSPLALFALRLWLAAAACAPLSAAAFSIEAISVSPTNVIGEADVSFDILIKTPGNPATWSGYSFAVDPGRVTFWIDVSDPGPGSISYSVVHASLPGSLLSQTHYGRIEVVVNLHGSYEPNWGTRVAATSYFKLPRLGIEKIGYGGKISWPVVNDSALQLSTNLVDWFPVIEPAVTNGESVAVTFPYWSPRRFFRLRMD